MSKLILFSICALLCCSMNIFADGKGATDTEALLHANNNISPAALDAIIKYSQNKERCSVLNYAILIAHDWKAADALIEAGIGINSKDFTPGLTPLAILLDFASQGHPYKENGTALLRKLIQKGIDVSLQMHNGLNQGQYAIVDVGYFYMSPHLRPELDLFLTKYKIDLNFHSEVAKYTALQRALQFSNVNGSLETLKILMKHGASVNKIDCFSHMAAQGDYDAEIEIIQFLISKGANPLMVSDVDPKIRSIDYFLKKVLRLPNSYDAYKRQMVPYLIVLGAHCD